MSGLSALAVLAVLGLTQGFSPHCVPSAVTGSGSQCTATGKEGTLCMLACGICSSPFLGITVSLADAKAGCGRGSAEETVRIATAAVVGLGRLQGQFFLDDPGNIEVNGTAAMAYLLAHMPRRDLMLLFGRTLEFTDFLFENVRLALRVWPFSHKFGVPWHVFLDSVLPYAVLDEKRDVDWHGRRKFHRLSSWAPPTNATTGLPITGLPVPLGSAANLTQAMESVVKLIPHYFPEASYELDLLGADGADLLVHGNPIRWRSEMSPAMLSPEQVVIYDGASCTGTAVILVAVARAVGIPCRIAGCSESIVRGDDHHWVEFWDSNSPGPFNDTWHTKEGVSKGNAGGPWDGVSGPMAGCLRGVIAGSSMDNLWAGSWKSDTFLPTQWANSTLDEEFAFVGGINRCGAYCTSWGCGPNRTSFFAQSECTPK